MKDPRLEPLAELQERLENLLSLLDEGEGAEISVIDSAWKRSAESFEAFRQLDEGKTERPPEVRDAMEKALRLQALATTVVAQWKEELTEKLRKVGALRPRMRALRATSALGAGGACDIAG